MNYRHHFHAGNFADVFKHALLIQLVRALQRKPGGLLLVDTHAGWGGYDLERAAQGDSHPRPPEHPDGIGRLWPATDLPPALAEYVAWVRAFQDEAGTMHETGSTAPRHYPGSPWFLRRLAREQDRLALAEIDPEAAEALEIAFGRFPRVSVRAGDGYNAPAALLPPPERRAFVLIDPPYEAADEWEQVEAALGKGLRRLPAGVFAIWYPLTARAGSAEFLDRLAATGLPPALAIELTVDPGAPMRGCGLVVVNPPWRFEIESEGWLRRLAALLARAPAAGAGWRWIVPERQAGSQR